nr:tRNA lysidine(34) synthetase TilS [Sinobaca sp. H24]
MKQKIESFIKKHSLLQEGDHVIAAVSGGADSMALLHVLDELADALQISVSAAHADHGLRPEDSKAERDMVEAYCQSRSIPFYTEVLPVRDYLSEQGKGVQEQARVLRYQFLEKVMKECGAAVLATGHHGDDQIETMLLRMTVGRALWEDIGIASSRQHSRERLSGRC